MLCFRSYMMSGAEVPVCDIAHRAPERADRTERARWPEQGGGGNLVQGLGGHG
jgi:hypothetical protein